MKSVLKKLAIVALALLPIVALTACSTLQPQVQQGITTAQKISADAQTAIDAAKAVAATLPSDSPELAQVDATIVKVQAVKDQADKYIAAANGVLTSLNSGVLDPTAATALGLLPYGSYIVAGATLVLALLQKAKASGALDDLKNVVASWEAVGGPTPAQKPVVAAVQGTSTTATVASIQTTLAIPKDETPVSTASTPTF